MASTFTEKGSHPTQSVRVLTYVLDYDDLLARGAQSFIVSDDALPFRLGRAPDAGPPRRADHSHLVVSDQWASTQHCHIRHVGTSDILQDDGSRNGTWVNGERVTRYRVLNDGDLIEVGHTVFSYRSVDESIASALSAVAGVSLGPTETRNPETAAVIRDLRLIAASPEPVLLVGESGVGKETAARAVHAWSGRRGPLRVIECAGVTEVVRQTIFADRGAAETARSGSSDDGTVLLQDVDRLGNTAQTTLLRAMEDGGGALAGDGRLRDVRWIATTTESALARERPGGPDLLRGLAGYVARLPPLRQRREDLGTLSAWLLAQGGWSRASITPAAGRALFLDDFAGNLRQLRTVLRAAATLAGDGPIELRHLPAMAFVGALAASQTVRAELTPEGRPPTVQEILEALESTGGNVVRAAECLGAHPRQVYRWVQRHDIDLERFRR